MGIGKLPEGEKAWPDFSPEHLLIIGGSCIGLAFAHVYRRFGSRVVVVQRGPRLIERDDEDVTAAVKEILQNEGVEIRLNADCIALEQRTEQVAVTATGCAPCSHRHRDRVHGSPSRACVGFEHCHRTTNDGKQTRRHATQDFLP